MTEEAYKHLTSLTKKREKLPKIDLDTNCFCVERQLGDEVQLMHYNKNPRRYSLKSTSPPKEKNYHNYSSLRENSLMEEEMREFKGKTDISTKAPTLLNYEDSSFLTSNSFQIIENQGIYRDKTESQIMSFGHRPQSASRMFNPLTLTTCLSPRERGTIYHQHPRIGMSSALLKQHLARGKDNYRKDNKKDNRKETNKEHRKEKKIAASEIKEQHEQQEKGFINNLFIESKPKRENLSLKDKNRKANELIHLHRLESAGVHFNIFCEEKQKKDWGDLTPSYLSPKKSNKKTHLEEH